MMSLSWLESVPWPSLAWQVAWQSSVVILVGLNASRLGRMRPSRAHRLLLGTALACLVVTPAALVVRRLDVGLFEARAEVRPAEVATAEPIIPSQTTDPVSTATAPVPTTISDAVPTRPRVVAARPMPAPPPLRMPPPEAPTTRGIPPLAAWIAAAWATLAALGVVRLIASLSLGIRIRATARVLDDPAVLAAADAAAGHLGLPWSPRVRSSRSVHCPVVWCWGRRPVLILPEADEHAIRDDHLAAILCHELAHWMRADHASALVAELLTCVLPWQPLAWQLRSRMADLAELACDDWALAHARSVSPDDYAETLLRLAAHRRRPLLPAAVSGRSGLVARVRHILDGGSPMPRPGRFWSLFVAGLCMGLVAVLALAQTRQASAVSEANQPPGRETTVEGIVRDAKGNPIPGAEVAWVVDEALLPDHAHRPIGHSDHNRRVLVTLAQRMSDAHGRFAIRARIRRLSPHSRPFSEVIAYKAGLAPRFKWAPIDRPIELVLEPALPIVGRLLTPGGEPAANVAVRLTGHTGTAGRSEFELGGRESEWEGRPAFLPGEFRTDASGRFVIDGYVPDRRLASLALHPTGYAPEVLTVATGDTTGILKPDSFSEIRPLPREFTHTLAEDRPVVGTITDEVTHEPLAGVTVGLVPLRDQGQGMHGTTIFTTTDAKGRYRVSDREANLYRVLVYPPIRSGYQSAEKGNIKWPAGERELRVDMALRRAHMVRGTVVDEATGGPLPGASIAFHHLDPDANVRRSGDAYPLYTVTDAQGRFAIAAEVGPGLIRADAAGRGYIRFDIGPVDYRVEPSRFSHGQAHVEVPSEGALGPPEVTIRLKKGLTLEAKVIRPDGSAADDARAWCPELAIGFYDDFWVTAEPPRDGLFRMPGAEPGRTYRIHFLTDDMKLGAVAEIRADAARTWVTEVKLQPTASIHGRLLDANGQPQKPGASYSLTLASQAHDGIMPHRTDFAGSVYDRVRPLNEDNPADFRYIGLVPGIRYFVTWSQDINPVQVTIEPLRPGEDRDIGELLPIPKPGPNLRAPAPGGVALSQAPTRRGSRPERTR